jgi:hypothetical protein
VSVIIHAQRLMVRVCAHDRDHHQYGANWHSAQRTSKAESADEPLDNWMHFHRKYPRYISPRNWPAPAAMTTIHSPMSP